MAGLLNPGRTAVINRAIDSTIREDYSGAILLMDSLIRAEPDRPEGWFFRAAIQSIRMTDEESFRHEAAFLADLDSAETRALQLEPVSHDTPDVAFCLASITSYRAYHASRREEWLKAVSLGLGAVRSFERVQELWPDFPDVRLGLGNYLFWKSVKMRAFQWMPFIEDERREGIRLVESARRSGEYHSWVAASNLSWMYLEDKQPQQALEICEEGLAHYPGSRLFLFPLGDALIQLQQWPRAEEVWRTILAQLESPTQNSGVNRVICHEKLARIAEARGDHARALDLARTGLGILVDKAQKSRVRDTRRRLQELLDSNN